MSDALERMKRWDAVVGVDEAVARAVAKERASVVAWLRGNRACCEHPSYRVSCLSRLAADEIERGKHRSEEKP